MGPVSLRHIARKLAPSSAEERGALDAAATLSSLFDLRESVVLAQRLAEPKAPRDAHKTPPAVADLEALDRRLREIRARLANALSPSRLSATTRVGPLDKRSTSAVATRIEERILREIALARMDVRDVRADVAELAQAHGGAWAEAERLDRALHDRVHLLLSIGRSGGECRGPERANVRDAFCHRFDRL